MVQRKFRAAYMQAKQGHKTEALPFRLLYTTLAIPFSWLSNFNGCTSTPGAFVSRNDNRGFYNQGAHPCFLDLRGGKKIHKALHLCGKWSVQRPHECMCVCMRKPADIFEWRGGSVRMGNRWGERDISGVAAAGTFRLQPPEKTAHQKKQQKEQNWNGIRE